MTQCFYLFCVYHAHPELVQTELKAEIIFFLPPCNAFWKDVRSDSVVEQEGKYSRDAAMSLQTDTPDARRLTPLGKRIAES